MDNRTLLERAAKAAEFYFHGLRVGHGYLNCYVSTTNDTDDWFVWSPLTDDGDALRLAVKLRIQVPVIGNGMHSDPFAATRRAIVRAAASMAGES